MITKKQKMRDKRAVTFVATVLLVLIIGVISVSAMFTKPQNSVYFTEINRFEDKNTTRQVRTEAKTVGEFLEEQNVALSAHDSLNHDINTPLGNKMKVVVTRGRAFTIQTGEAIVLCSTTQETLGDAMLQAGFYPQENDIVSHDLKEIVTDGLAVSVTSVTNENVQITEAIENTTEYVDDAALEQGKTKVIQEGFLGECQVTVNITYNDGVEVSRREISREVTKEPQNRIIATGTKVVKAPTETPKPTEKVSAQTQPKADSAVKAAAQKTQQAPEKQTASSEAGTVAGLSFSKKLTMSATGYTAFKSDGSRGITSTGRPAGQGIIAVDPSVIPLGTRVYVEGYGEAIAADIGPAIKGNKIDLCFEMTNAQIRQNFGRRNVTVYILS